MICLIEFLYYNHVYFIVEHVLDSNPLLYKETLNEGFKVFGKSWQKVYLKLFCTVIENTL
jgi:hypothetical protein